LLEAGNPEPNHGLPQAFRLLFSSLAMLTFILHFARGELMDSLSRSGEELILSVIYHVCHFACNFSLGIALAS
jgi:hypothetical protein